VEDKLGQAVEPSLVSLNDLKNEEDAIDRLLLDTGFDADDDLRVNVDAFSGFGEIKDDFAESNMIQEDDDGKTVQVIVDSVDFDDDLLAGLFVNTAETRSDLIDDKEKIQQAGSEEIAFRDVWQDDFLLPDLDIVADKEGPDTWIDLGIEEDKLAGAFNEPDLFSDDGALEDELEKIGLTSVSNEMPAEIKPKPSSDNNASVIEDAKNAVLSQIDAEPEKIDEQYKEQIKDAENKAKKATVLSYVSLGFFIVTFIAAVALAVMAYGAKTEILKLIELVSALEQGAGEGALKNPDEDNNVSVEQLNEQSQALSDLGENNPPEVIDEPVAEAAKAEAVSKPENLKPKAEVAKVKAVSDAGTAKPKIEVAKTKAVSKPENLKPKAEVAKVEVVSDAGTAKPKIGQTKTKATSKQENLKPKADTVKSAVVLEASVDKAVAANKTAVARKTITKIETAKKEPAKPTTKAVAPSIWTVQLAAYKQEWYAKSQAAGFKQKGVPVEVVHGDVNNTAWYRLRVGGFKNKGEAASYAARIKKTLNLSSISITDN
ncbi:MAG: SPOR domain-containing protein, partial [Methylobacter sp.]|nr:SPOR domain-containing protein [Methylobacter sp.]